jgi:hypothetical protein
LQALSHALRVGSPERLRVYRLYCAGTAEERLLQLSDRLPRLDALCQQSHGRSYSSAAKLFEDVLAHGAQQVMQAARSVQEGNGGDADMADAAPADDAEANGGGDEAGVAGGYSEEQVARALEADPAALLAAAAPAADAEGGGEAAAAGPATPASCPLGQPGSGLERATVVDLSGVRTELEEGEAEAEDSEDAFEGEDGGVPNGGEAEASRADSAAAAARQWESLLGEAWQELAREEEAALRAAGPEAEPGDEATNDEDADDVRRGVVLGRLQSMAGHTSQCIFMSAAV